MTVSHCRKLLRLTCKDIKYYPCRGANKQGRLVARCATRNDFPEPTSNSFLDDGYDTCRIGNLGYISNIDGTLRCDPTVNFENAMETPTAELIRTFQCSE